MERREWVVMAIHSLRGEPGRHAHTVFLAGRIQMTTFPKARNDAFAGVHQHPDGAWFEVYYRDRAEADAIRDRQFAQGRQVHPPGHVCYIKVGWFWSTPDRGPAYGPYTSSRQAYAAAIKELTGK